MHRIGLIIPSGNQCTEPQFQRYAPADVVIHATRVQISRPGGQLIPLLEQLPDILRGAQLLADARCDLIVYHCTGSSMEAGLAAERQVVEAIEQATGIPATTTASAVLAALEALNVRRLVMVSPYPQYINDDEKAFLEEAGLSVLCERALNLPSREWATTPPEFWVSALEENAETTTDLYFMSCTNIRSIDAVDAAEARLGRPALSSNQATLWHCLRLLGRDDVVPGLGRLFRLGLTPAVTA
ncbi:MAG: hypothetical protein AAB289_08080 [Chloroflexota bacterium]